MISKLHIASFFFLFIAGSLYAHDIVSLDKEHSVVNEYSSLRGNDSTDLSLSEQFGPMNKSSFRRLINYLKKNPSVLIYGTAVTSILAIGGYIGFQEVIRTLYQEGAFNLPYNHPSGNLTTCPPISCLQSPDFPVYWLDTERNKYYVPKVSPTNCSWDGQPHLVPGNMSLPEMAGERTGCNSSFLSAVQSHMFEYEQANSRLPNYLMCAPNGNNSLCCANAWFGLPEADISCYGYLCLQVFKAATQRDFADCMVKRAFSSFTSPLSVYVEVVGSLLFFLFTYSIWNAWGM